jgi:hypothetical protein
MVYMKWNAILPLVWFPLAIVLLTINIWVLSYTPLDTVAKVQPLIAYARESTEIIETHVTSDDARVLLVESFFRTYNAPLEKFAGLLVSVSDANNIDWKLLPAISMCESLGGKRIPESVGFNPFGIAVYTGQANGKRFEDWDHAINWTANLIKEKYVSNGMLDLIDMGAKWAPPSVEKGNSWANCVQSFMDKIL